MLSRDVTVGERYEAGIHGVVKVLFIFHSRCPGEKAVLKVQLAGGQDTCLFPQALTSHVVAKTGTF